ncbi:hypothetical protein DL93DRAFT_2117714 [Clavulina sp. PMI_390]|nr:hypothetical protein DL93DRAFT_2117714 [Clavulina sp. PMI_390]
MTLLGGKLQKASMLQHHLAHPAHQSLLALLGNGPMRPFLSTYTSLLLKLHALDTILKSFGTQSLSFCQNLTSPITLCPKHSALSHSLKCWGKFLNVSRLAASHIISSRRTLSVRTSSVGYKGDRQRMPCWLSLTILRQLQITSSHHQC